MKKSLLLALGLFASISSASAGTITEAVDKWTVQYRVGLNDPYMTPPTFDGTSVVIKGTGSSCSGALSFAGGTVEDMKMFMNHYLLAKAAGLKMIVSFGDSNGCQISWFQLAPT